ncbi:MAG TPA: hypothetical protein PLB30_09235 [Thermoleophilia bacterium]|nr:hypothetical protein [Thermoleophilia bacterium]
MNGASNEPGIVGPAGAAPEPEPSAERALARLELPDAAAELLAVVRFLTAPDGPLQQPVADGPSSPWQERVLVKAQERLAIIDHFLRGRVAFFAALERL